MSPKEETKGGVQPATPTKKGQNFQIALAFGGLVIAITAYMTKGAPPKANEQVLVSTPKQAESLVSPPNKAKSPVSTPSTTGSDTAQPPYLALAQWDPGAPPEISDAIPASWTDQRKADTYGCQGKRLFEGEANSKAAAFKLAGLAQGRCVIWQTNGHLAIYDGVPKRDVPGVGRYGLFVVPASRYRGPVQQGTPALRRSLTNSRRLRHRP